MYCHLPLCICDLKLLHPVAQIKLMTAERFVTENLYNPLLFANNALAELMQTRDVANLDMEKAMALLRVASACHVAIRTLGQIDFSRYTKGFVYGR